MVTNGNHTYHGEHLVMYVTVELLSCSSEANTILHIKYFN